MGFDMLLGNHQLKENLSGSLRRGRISHFYLISGPEGAGKHTLARLMGAAILCKENDKPCCRCRSCRKVLEGSHPDFITVDDPEKKTVTVDLIRQARADIYVQPNESDHKIYLFPRAQDMGIPGQNALLKVLEEPPSYGVFILLTDNPNKLLPTVRSRCTEIKTQALEPQIMEQALRRDFPQASTEDLQAAAQRSGGFLGQAQLLLQSGSAPAPQTVNFLEALSAKNSYLLAQTLVPMEKWKRDALADMLGTWLEMVENALLCRGGIQVISPQARQLSHMRTGEELHHIALCLKKALDYTGANVSPAAVCGYLLWALK